MLHIKTFIFEGLSGRHGKMSGEMVLSINCHTKASETAACPKLSYVGGKPYIPRSEWQCPASTTCSRSWSTKLLGLAPSKLVSEKCDLDPSPPVSTKRMLKTKMAPKAKHDQLILMNSDEGTASSPKAAPPTSSTKRPSLLRSVFSLSSFQHHLSLNSSTGVSPSQLEATPAPSTPISTAPASQDITAVDKMSEASMDYFVSDFTSPMSTPGRGLVPVTTAPKTLGIDWRYGAQGKHGSAEATSLSV